MPQRYLSRSLEGSFQVCPDYFEELLGGIGIQRVGMLFRIDQVRAHVFLNHFGHKTGHRPACAGNQMHHLIAARFTAECTFDRLDLAANATDTCEELFLFADGMGHALL
jgi:hypothetical protein